MSSHTPGDAAGVASADLGSASKREALELFRGLPRRYDLLSAALSFGQDPRWRRALVRAVAPRSGDRILDVATGTGMVAAELLARADCSVVGIDQSAEMLAAARARFAPRRAAGGSASAVELIEGQAEALPFADGSFDALTFTYLLRYVEDPPATLRELARVVRPGGTIAGLEFGVPHGPWRPLWELYVQVGLRTAGAVIGNGWREVGSFLGGSIRDFGERWPVPRQLEAWTAAGIDGVQARRLSLGGGVVTWGRRNQGAD
jgi:demethylmenaquinone methyltransferase/2-methoxy-6-polyprenyl-1,4-benzoquinol methylase